MVTEEPGKWGSLFGKKWDFVSYSSWIWMLCLPPYLKVGQNFKISYYNYPVPHWWMQFPLKFFLCLKGIIGFCNWFRNSHSVEKCAVWSLFYPHS